MSALPTSGPATDSGRSIGGRLLIAVSLTLALVAAVPAAPLHPSLARPAAAACVDGYGYVSTSGKLFPQGVLAKSAGKALLAGGTGQGFGRRAATIASHVRKSGRWSIVASLRPTLDSGFTAIGGRPAGRLWAVGYARRWTGRAPLIASRAGSGRWRQVPVPKGARDGVMLTDVGSYRADRAWAVGYKVGRPGRQRPLVLRWNGRRWSRTDPGLRSNETGMLTGVSTSRRAGTWVAGSVIRGSRMSPYIARRTARGWKRQSLPDIGEGALSDIVMTSRRAGVAVGYRASGADGVRALVLRWNGSRWKEVKAPSFGKGETMLTAAAAMGPVRFVVSGTTWNDDAGRFQAVAARWDGSEWHRSVDRSVPSHGLNTDVDGDPGEDGWIAGRAWKVGGSVAKTCEAPAPARGTARAERSKRRGAVAVAAAAADAGGSDLEARPRSASVTARAVEPVAAPAGLTVRDVAESVGLPARSNTWSAVVADFDDDGRDDIFLGRHGKVPRLFLDRGARYRDAGVDFGQGDRHGCAAHDVDGSGLPDLYCGLGAARGAGIKANQLWLDPGGRSPRLHPDAGGALEPLGRSRKALFLDADDDGKRDLIIGQQPNRIDGLPSANRVYLREGDADLRLRRASGLKAGIGAIGLDDGDFDRDGRMDLLLIYHDQRAAKPRSGIILYRNTAAGFRDVSKAWGVRSIGERDAELVRIDGDARPDLVQLSGGRLKISLQRAGRFVKAYDRAVSGGVALATGDADGDGDTDLYVLRQKDRKGQRDLIFLNRGSGRSFRVIGAPSAHGGAADDVVAIDHDQNGMMDFLALNGVGESAGPVQLVAFFR